MNKMDIDTLDRIVDSAVEFIDRQENILMLEDEEGYDWWLDNWKVQAVVSIIEEVCEFRIKYR